MDREADGCPDVNGAAEAELAPLNAPAPAVALGLAMVALLGLRTLRPWLVDGLDTTIRVKTYASMTCTTPLAISTSGVMTRALLTKTRPPLMVMVRSLPFKALSTVPFLRPEL
jgi:hypothetical protein